MGRYGQRPRGLLPAGSSEVQALGATWWSSQCPPEGAPPRVPTYLLSSHFCQLGIWVHDLVAWWSLRPLPTWQWGEQEARGGAQQLGKKETEKPSRHRCPRFLPPFPQPPPSPLPSAAKGAACPLTAPSCTVPHQPHRELSRQALWPAPSPHPPGYLTCCWPQEATCHRPATQANRDVLPRSHLLLQDPRGGTKKRLTISNN